MTTAGANESAIHHGRYLAASATLYRPGLAQPAAAPPSSIFSPLLVRSHCRTLIYRRIKLHRCGPSPPRIRDTPHLTYRERYTYDDNNCTKTIRPWRDPVVSYRAGAGRGGNTGYIIYHIIVCVTVDPILMVFLEEDTYSRPAEDTRTEKKKKEV